MLEMTHTPKSCAGGDARHSRDRPAEVRALPARRNARARAQGWLSLHAADRVFTELCGARV